MAARQQFPSAQWDGHLQLLHSTEDERRAGLSAWVRRGLEREEKVLYTELPKDPPDSLVAVLESHGVDATAAVRDGRLALLSLEEFYPQQGQRTVVEHGLAEGFSGVRMSAETAAALTMLTPEVYLGVERQMDELVRTRPVSAMCQYSRSATTGSVLGDTVPVHLSGVRASNFTTSQNEHGLVLHGEIDAANTEVFTAVLAGAVARASRVLWLDLAELSFIDAGACGRYEDLTAEFRATGGHVLLVAPPPPVERTLRLLEIDALPGVELVGDAP